MGSRISCASSSRDSPERVAAMEHDLLASDLKSLAARATS
jgi:hypothetical protein